MWANPFLGCGAIPSGCARSLPNLIGNAVKFTNRGCVTLTAEVRDGAVAVHVSDTGIGIPEEARPGCSSEFFQVGQMRASEASALPRGARGIGFRERQR